MSAANSNPQPQFAGYAPGAGPGFPQYVMVPVRERNGLGVFGFFIALIGLFIPTGIVALLGLLICLVALGRSPRGFAFMGLVIGLIGTVLWLVIDLAVIVGGLIVMLAMAVGMSAAFVITQPEVVEISSDMLNAAMSIEEKYHESDEVPGDIESLGLSVAAMTDPWGARYRYQINDRELNNIYNERGELNYEMISAGPDGAFDTDDDIKLSSLDRLWENAFENFGEKMEEFGEKMEGMNNRRYAYGQDSCAFTFGSCDTQPDRAVVAAPAPVIDTPVPPVAPRSFAEGYEIRAKESIEHGQAKVDIVGEDEPADTADVVTPDALDAEDTADASGEGPAQ